MNMQSTLLAAMEAAQHHVEPAALANDTTHDSVGAPSCYNDDSSTVANIEARQANDDVNVNQPVNATTVSPFISVADAVRPIIQLAEMQPTAKIAAEATRKSVQIKRLNEKACLIKVKRRMYSPYKHDDEETRKYAVGNVNKRLFEGRDNRVAQAISAYNDVYTFLKDNTVPWDTGTDMVNMLHYTDLMAGLRAKVAVAEAAADDCEAHWHQEVLDDIDRIRFKCIAKGIPDRSDPDDYPDSIRDRFSIDIRPMPIPDSSQFDPRFGMTDEDLEALERQLTDVETNATKHVINQMLEPMQRAVDKLKVDIGKDGAVFRDSLIDNLVDVADRMARVNISDDPTVTEHIKDLRSLVSSYANNKDVLRSSPPVRAKAAQQINDLVGQMAGLV